MVLSGHFGFRYNTVVFRSLDTDKIRVYGCTASVKVSLFRTPFFIAHSEKDRNPSTLRKAVPFKLNEAPTLILSVSPIIILRV